ncbi:MAG: galactose-1-epimerase, partial [Burkholderiales bacterium]|nr:galactose-1-epimerase [Burkholderiales bacterium]
IGALIGRYAGRIAYGRCSVDGAELALSTNKGLHHLHGGFNGFDRILWDAEILCEPPRLVLRHTSPAGTEGYPGTLSTQVTYTLTNDALRVDYAATTDATTPVNLTQHSYFNLSGHASGDVLRHTLRIEADGIIELGQNSIPTGRILPVAGTPFDFRETKRLDEDIHVAHPQLDLAKGYDHNWILAANNGKPNVVLSEAVSGRRLEIYTTQPGIQVYTANYFAGSVAGKGGSVYPMHAGIALETQHFPDS